MLKIMKRVVKISRGGQISIPAEIRHRWETQTLILEDRGGEIVIHPVDDDPITAYRGIFADASRGPVDWSSYKRDELDAEEAKWRRYSTGAG
jgi:AbrB family looped-hinge helix DNA binding protein